MVCTVIASLNVLVSPHAWAMDTAHMIVEPDVQKIVLLSFNRGQSYSLSSGWPSGVSGQWKPWMRQYTALLEGLKTPRRVPHFILYWGDDSSTYSPEFTSVDSWDIMARCGITISWNTMLPRSSVPELRTFSRVMLRFPAPLSDIANRLHECRDAFLATPGLYNKRLFPACRCAMDDQIADRWHWKSFSKYAATPSNVPGWNICTLSL